MFTADVGNVELVEAAEDLLNLKSVRGPGDRSGTILRILPWHLLRPSRLNPLIWHRGQIERRKPRSIGVGSERLREQGGWPVGR